MLISIQDVLQYTYHNHWLLEFDTKELQDYLNSLKYTNLSNYLIFILLSYN